MLLQRVPDRGQGLRRGFLLRSLLDVGIQVVVQLPEIVSVRVLPATLGGDCFQCELGGERAQYRHDEDSRDEPLHELIRVTRRGLPACYKVG